MRLKWKLLTATVFCISQLHAQDQPKPKLVDHYFNVQANRILKELINFSTATSQNNNPYFFNYGAFLNKSGWGARAGIGADYVKQVNKDATNKVSKSSTLDFRIGIGKKIHINNNMEVGFSLDYTKHYLYSEINSISVEDFFSQIDSISAESRKQVKGYGFGPEIDFSIKLAKNLWVGTEMTYYYNRFVEKENNTSLSSTTQISTNTTIYSYLNSKLEFERESFSFTIPVAVFLILKI